MDQLEVYTSLLFDVELFDDMVEEAIEEGPAGRDIENALHIAQHYCPFFMIESGDGGSRYSHSVEAVARKGRASLPAKVGIPHLFLSFFLGFRLL